MEFKGNPWMLLRVISGIMLLMIIMWGDPDPWHYSVFIGDIISLVWDLASWVRDKYF